MSRITAYLLVLVVLTLTVTGFSSTGTAVAAVVSRQVDTPSPDGSSIIKYTDGDGNIKTKYIDGSGGSTTSTDSSGAMTAKLQAEYGNTVDQLPQIVSNKPNPALQACLYLRGISGIMSAACKAILRTISGTSGGAIKDQSISLPNGFIPKPGAEASINGCAECLGGYFDPSTNVWYANPGEKFGYYTPVINRPAANSSSGIQIVSRLKFFNPLANGWGKTASHSIATSCSTGAYPELNRSNTLSPTPSTDSSVGSAAAGWLTNGTVNASTPLSTYASVLACENGGGVIKFVLKALFPNPTGSVVVAVAFSKTPTMITPGDSGEGTITATLECMNAAGELSKVVASLDGILAVPGAVVKLPDLGCGQGGFAVSKKVDFQPKGSTTPAQNVLDPAKSTPTPPVADGTAASEADCYNGTKACILEVRKGSGESCGPNAVYCADWAKDPNATGNYKCTYGGKDVDINKCSPLRAPNIGPLPGTDKDGNQLPYNAPVPEEFDNEVGEDQADQIGGEGKSDSADGQACFPTGWAVLNPVEWVMKPVGCAISKAFTPDADVIQSTFGDLPAKFGETTPGKLMTTLEGISFTGATGCRGMGVNMGWVPYANLGTYYLLPACAGDFFATTAGMFKVFMYGTIALGGFFGVTRQISGLVNAQGLGNGS